MSKKYENKKKAISRYNEKRLKQGFKTVTIRSTEQTANIFSNLTERMAMTKTALFELLVIEKLNEENFADSMENENN